MKFDNVVHISGGASSGEAGIRVVERYGAENTTFLFADTLAEDPDLYRFLEDLTAITGVAITRLCEGRTPMQVFIDEGYIGNSRVAPCSRILKQELLDAWHAKHTNSAETTIYLGMDWTEGDRHRRAAKRLVPYQVVSPLADWKPTIDKAGAHRSIVGRGLKLPHLYAWAQNNNCGGLCVRGGQAHWIAALRNIPERYAEMEATEEAIRERRGDVAILKDRSGGGDRPLPLKELREGIQAGKRFDLFDWGACGCEPMLDPEPPARNG